MSSKLTYDQAMEELQAIVRELQEQAVNMDDLSDKVKRAADLLTYCREKLRSTEKETEGLFGESQTK